MEEKTYKLLAADDDQDILPILPLILTQEGYQVLPPGTARKFWSWQMNPSTFIFWMSTCRYSPASPPPTS